MPGEKEYTIQEVADMKGVSHSTIRRRIKEGKINAEKRKSRYGEQYFIPASEIDQAVMQQEVLEFEKSVEVSKEEVKNELIEAVNSQNEQVAEQLMEKVGNRFDRLEKQNTYLKQQVYELKEFIKKDINGDMDKAEDNIKETIESQNKQLQEEVQALKEEVKQLREEQKEQQNKGLLDKIKSWFQ